MRLPRCLHCRRPIEERNKPGQPDKWMHIDTLVPWCSPERHLETVPTRKHSKRSRYLQSGGYVAEPIPIREEAFCA